MSAGPLIRRGEQVIVDGQLICEAKHDIYSGDLCRPIDFQWFITPPATGDAFDGTPGFRSGQYGQPDIFISGEWLSKRRRPVAEPGAFQRYTGHEPLYVEHGLVGRKPHD